MALFPFIMPVLSVPPILALEATDERTAIFDTVALLRGHVWVRDAGLLAKAVWERQQIHPPLLGDQIALPHARTAAVQELVFAAARLVVPVSFGPEKLPVRLLFLFGVPRHRITEYLGATAQLVRILRDPARCAALLSAANEAEFLTALGATIA